MELDSQFSSSHGENVYKIAKTVLKILKKNNRLENLEKVCVCVWEPGLPDIKTTFVLDFLAF